ncbi:unnamed protein product [Paramecium pentaurelia]|uniref:Uncharacterized protein n=1 Tax=Paramecium pentaurelia TaxID=43138 RepID=A0A8S1V496_9CILI|nr:unnamed protein product [Paramecium pentaurelia]
MKAPLRQFVVKKNKFEEQKLLSCSQTLRFINFKYQSSSSTYYVNKHIITHKIVNQKKMTQVGSRQITILIGAEKEKIKSINQLGIFQKKIRWLYPFYIYKQEQFSKSVLQYNIPSLMEQIDGMCPNQNKRTFNIIFAEI